MTTEVNCNTISLRKCVITECYITIWQLGTFVSSNGGRNDLKMEVCTIGLDKDEGGGSVRALNYNTIGETTNITAMIE